MVFHPLTCFLDCLVLYKLLKGKIEFVNLKDPVNGYRWASSTRLEFDEDPISNGWDTNASFTIDNVVGGTAKFNPNSKSIDFVGNSVQVTLTLTYRDRRASDGFALDAILVAVSYTHLRAHET